MLFGCDKMPKNMLHCKWINFGKRRQDTLTFVCLVVNFDNTLTSAIDDVTKFIDAEVDYFKVHT